MEPPTVVAALTDLDDEPAAREYADLVEFRMDQYDGDPLAALARYDGDLSIIATNRVTTEGGDAPDRPARLDALAAAAEVTAVDAVDVEAAWLAAGRADQVRAAATDTRIIASVHDFEGTPSVQAGKVQLRKACEQGAIGKLAVMANDHDDALRLLRLTRWAAAEGLPAATMAMGPAGRHTRALAPLYGSRLTYAPVDTEAATAPGQYDLRTLRTLLEQL
ncbi:MAG: type I 3-dehydroquinate dehydratase [Halobacteriaceae archaeon]